MKTPMILAIAMMGAVSAFGQAPLDAVLLPYSDPVNSGMTAAKKQFLMLHRKGCQGYWRFVSLCEAKLKDDPGFFRRDGWVYQLSAQATQELTKEGAGILEIGNPQETPLSLAIKKYPGLFDPTTNAYLAFHKFATSPGATFQSVDEAMNAYVAFLAVEKERTDRENSANRTGSSTMLAEQRARDEAARASQAAANEATRQNVEASKRRKAEREAAAAAAAAARSRNR